MILADKIMMLRKKNGWSQEELANQLSVSRQSVSKWESAQSVPELEKILMMSKLFGVTTDYLLKDEVEEEEFTPIEEEIAPVIRKVSLEEANEFLKVKAETARYMAFATFLCIISPVCLLMLAGISETGLVAENVAVSVGVIVLLMMVAFGVAIFIYCGSKFAPYEYLEKEPIETEYGVNGMVKERQKQYQTTYTKYNVIGTCLCILSAVPIFAGIIINEELELLTLAMVCGTLFMVGIGVMFFVTAGSYWGSYQRLLEEGDFTRAKKYAAKKNGKVLSVYWVMVTAIYLAWSFATMNWHRTWIIWPVAGVVSFLIALICDIIFKNEEN
ncbi:MAG: helix-turn-helix transcriptional regulator [Lachnospiraceae bacterium]|nr:helix-turn-helix transcriptional regulator [Lachnospiraceae bacterium]